MARFTGKDDPERFIDNALDGGTRPPDHEKGYQESMTSNGLTKHPVDRKNQHILTAIGLDNVGKVYHTYESSMAEVGGVAGGPTNLEHSLRGASAVNEHLGAAGHTKPVIIPNH